MVTTIRNEVHALRDDHTEQHDPAKLLDEHTAGNRIGHQPMRTPLSLPNRSMSLR